MLIFTARGVLANYAAHQRPTEADIFAFSPDERVARALLMNRAVTPFTMEMEDSPPETILKAVAMLKEKGLVADGDPLVILSDILDRDFDTEAILVRKA